jgi:hypothetical protein
MGTDDHGSARVKEILHRFSQRARDYCTLIDAAATLDVNDFLRQAQSALHEISAAALELPACAPDEGMTEAQRMSYQESHDLFEALGRILGEYEGYWTVSFPYDDSVEPVYASLADDLADIYRDLKEGLALYDEHGSSDNTLWALRFQYMAHWGAHATDAMKAIHEVLRENDEYS